MIFGITEREFGLIIVIVALIMLCVSLYKNMLFLQAQQLSQIAAAEKAEKVTAAPVSALPTKKVMFCDETTCYLPEPPIVPESYEIEAQEKDEESPNIVVEYTSEDEKEKEDDESDESDKSTVVFDL